MSRAVQSRVIRECVSAVSLAQRGVVRTIFMFIRAHPYTRLGVWETMYNLMSEDTLLVNIQETFYDFEPHRRFLTSD